MPNTLNLYDTYFMLNVLEERKTPRTFMRNRYFGAPGTGRVFNTEEVVIDVIKDKRRMAPFVNPKHEGKLIGKRGYRTRTYKPTYIKPKIETSAQDILKRWPGNVLFQQNAGPAEMAARTLGRELAQLDDMILRREEWMAVQALLTGQLRFKGEGVDETLSFYMNTSQLPVLAGTARWSDHTNAEPLDDLKRWKRQVAKASGISPIDAIMGLDAIDNLLKCEQVIGTTGGGQSMFDLRRIDMGEIKPELLPDGVTYYGRLRETGLNIWTYEEWYVDDDSDVENPMIPANKVFLGNPAARTEFLYGAIKDIDALAAVPRFPKQWSEPDPSVRFLMLQSAPLPVPTQIDAFLTATVL